MKDVITKGQRFGMLKILKEGKRLTLPCGQTNRTVQVKCDCGRIKDVRWVHLKNGRTLSCGCATKTMDGESNTRLGKIYRAMMYRCSENYFERQYYFDRGIKVCSEWKNSYAAFKEWALNNGYDSDLTIDRINGDLGYFPGNCRWATDKVQANNKRDTFYVEYEGEKIALMLLLEKKQLTKHQAAIRGRLKRGWCIEDAINKPIRKLTKQ